MTRQTGAGRWRNQPFSPEVRERAVRLVQEQRGAHETQWAAIRSIAEKIGCHVETLRLWVRQSERDAELRPGIATEERERLTQLDGNPAAMNAGGWFGRSVAIGAITGLIGTAATVGVAGGSGVELPRKQRVTIARQPMLVQQTVDKS